MSIEKNNFDKCIDSCKEMDAIYLFLSEKKVLSLNIDSILRAEYVLIISAFDFYIHQIVCKKMVDMFQNGSIASDERLISMREMQLIFQTTNTSTQHDLLLASLRKKFSKDSFQSSRSIEYALGLIGIHNIWTNLSPRMGDTPNNIKNRLDVIVLRRNQIAHEADFDFSMTSLRPITITDINECRAFIENMVSIIDSMII